MKRLLTGVLIGIFLLAPVLASARTVLYVSKDNCAGLGCDCLDTEDQLFCDKLKELGYDVIINTEGGVKDNSAVWKSDVEKADIIFLGDVSESMIDKTKDQPAFCKNIKDSGKKVFATFDNVYKNRSLEGCAFMLALASYPDDDNVCKINNLRITDEGYITKGFPLNNVTQVYTEAQDIKINFGRTWASAYCDPPGDIAKTELYSTIATSDRGTFWGLDKPSKFTKEGWLFFERAALFTTGDHTWNITYFTIPEKISAGRAFMLFAKVKSLARPITEGAINVSLEENLLGSLIYNNGTGYWENRALSIDTSGDLKIEASESSLSELKKAGSLDVRIVSGSYVPDETYTAKARVFFQDKVMPAEVEYRVWKSSDLTVLQEGTMSLLAGTYFKDFKFGDEGELILEVTATNASLTGGAFKVIRPGNVSEILYTVEPSEWVITATKPGFETMTFTIEAGEEMTGLRVDKSGELANYILLDTNKTTTALPSGQSTEFSATLDWSKLLEGEKTGEIFVDSDQFSVTIPVRFAYFQILAGDWLEVEPKVLKATASKGRSTVQTVKLFNNANFPTTGMKLTATGELEGVVSFAKEPYYLEKNERRDVELLFDATGLQEGTYSGAITITSSLGTAEIEIAELTVTPDVSDMLDDLKVEWLGAVANLTDNGRVPLSAEAAILSESVNSTIQEAEDALALDDYDTATRLYGFARTDLDELKKFEPPAGVDWLVVILVLVGVGLLAYVGWRLWKSRKKKKPAKKAELPKAEEEYRIEYY